MNPYQMAIRYVGISERSGAFNFNPFIAAWIEDAGGPSPLGDETPWCGAFCYHIAGRLLVLETPKLPMRARSWLTVGDGVPAPGKGRPDYAGLGQPCIGDVVILSRGPLPQPGPDVHAAPGHVGFLAPPFGINPSEMVNILGGNQEDAVNIQPFPISRVLGVRRLRQARRPAVKI